jgi:hypothetical protein
MRKFFGLGIFGGILFFATQASALELVILGGPSISDPSFSKTSVPTDTVTDSATASGVGFTFGALVRLPLSPDFQLETGLTYLQRNYTISVLGGANYSFDETLKGIHIPVLIRAHIIDSLSVGLGGYLVHEFGDVYDSNVILNNQAQADAANSYDQNQYNRNDFGLEGSIAYDLPLSNGYSATVDVRYLLGLTDFGAGSSTSLKSRDVLFMAGLKLAI